MPGSPAGGSRVSGTLLQIAILFASLSLLAVGGGNGVIPAMQHASVDVHHWMTAQEFLDAFALSRAAPGPGSLIVVLVGQRAAGLTGALVAAVAMYTPACLAVYFAARVWRRYETAPWRLLAERALAPVSVGMIFASGLVLARASDSGWLGWGTTGGATLALALTELNPLWVMLAAGALWLAVG